MANSDTADAKKYSTIAELAAAQAKAYYDEMGNGAQYATEAKASADSAASSSDTASQVLEQVQSYTSTAETAASDSATSAQSASASALSAAEFGDNKNTFADTASGLAGTTTGQYFRVPQGADDVVAFKYYINASGAAQEVASYPGQASITNNIREYPDLVTAQADVSAGNVLSGSFCYVQTAGSDSLSDEYLNNSGTLTATGRKTPQYDSIKNLIPLNSSTIFKDESTGEFSFGMSFDTITLDNNNNVISYTLGSKQYFLIGASYGSLEADSVEIDGIQLDPNGTLTSSDKNNVVALGETTEYSVLDSSGEFEFAQKFDTATLDSEGNVMWYTQGGQEFSLLAGNYPSLFIDGVQVDASGILPSSDKTNLTTLSATTTFSSASSEFAFNQKSCVLIDANKNILFDVDDYLTRSANWDVAYEKSQEITPQKTNPLAPWSQVDSSGKYQISVLDTSSGAQVQVTSGTSNETNPRPDDLDRIVWQSDRADAPPGGLFYADSTDFKEHAYIARTKIVGWGHSFMNNGAFLNRMRVLTGLDTYNFGISGQTSDAIAARQGGAPAYYAPVGGSIPASGAVNLTPAVAGPCRSLATPVALKCNLAGVDGTFTWDGTNATFTRLTDGDAVNVSAAVALFVYPITTTNVSGSIASGTEFDLHNECINLFWIGRNNISETSLILSNAISMVNYVKNIGQKIVIMSDFNSSTEPPGSAAYSQMTTINAAIADKFPEFYCAIGGVDVRQNFINNANPASANDMADVAAGLTPRSLRYDNLHPSQTTATSLDPTYALDAGANVNANFVYQFIQDKGWL